MSLMQPTGIAPNGGTTSATLNRAMETLFENWQTVYERAQRLGDALARHGRRTAIQLAALQPQLSATELTADVPSDTYRFDAHNLAYQGSSLIALAETTATVWPEYGVVTPCVRELPQNQFTVQDANGHAWLPRTVRLQYALKPVTENLEDTNPDVVGGWVDETDPVQLAYAFDGRGTTAWGVDIPPTYDSQDVGVWIKATLPLEYLYMTTANAIAIHPEPMFGALLRGLWYGADAGLDGVPQPWTGYIQSEQVNSAGRPAAPELLFVPEARVAVVKAYYVLPSSITAAGLRSFYLSHLGVYQLTFDAESVLTLDLEGLVSPPERLLAATGHAVNPLASRTTAPSAAADLVASTLTIPLRYTATAGPQTLRTIDICTERG